MKVVINSVHGGFDPSEKLAKFLIDKKGWECSYGYDEDGNYENSNARLVKGDFGYQFIRPWNKDLRTDKDLIDGIEELGKEDASSRHSSLKIVEIPDDIEWTIEEYDGIEWIAEEHRTWE